MSELTAEERKLQWHCRRGLKELDVILGPFFEQHYLSLSATDQAAFSRLIDCEDMDLFNWFMRQDTPADPEMERMIELVLAHLGR